MSHNRSGTQVRFLVGDRDHHESLDLVEPLDQPDSGRHVGDDVQQVGVDVLATLLLPLLRRASRLVEVDVPLRGALDDRADAARAAQVVFEVEPTRGVETRGQQVVQRAPVEAGRTHRLPVVAGRQQRRRMPPPARNRQAQLHHHGALEQGQVLHRVDDHAVEIGEPWRQLVVPQPRDRGDRCRQVRKDAREGLRLDVPGHLQEARGRRSQRHPAARRSARGRYR